MEFVKKTALLFLALGSPFLRAEEGVSERSLPLILQSSAEYEKRLQGQPLEIAVTEQEEADTDPAQAFDKRRILYLMSKGQTTKAIKQYLAIYEQEKKHDRQILHEIGQLILETGMKSSDIETQILTLVGLSLSGQSSSLHYLEQALQSRFPMVQSIALRLVAQKNEDECDQLLTTAMRSDYLLVRYEALHYLVSRKSKNAVGYIDSLINLLHPAARPLFVELYAMYGSQEAVQRLKQFLNDTDNNVRIAAISSIHAHHYDNLLPNIRSLFTHSDPAIKEACAAALGSMKDLHSIEALKIAAESPFEETALAALLALHEMGDQTAKEKIVGYAKRKNLFAIYLLSKIDGYEDLLSLLATNIDSNVRLNASLALLAKRNNHCLPVVKDILSTDIKYVGFVPFVSKGRSLVAWRTTAPSAVSHPDIKRNIQAISLSLIQETMTACLELPGDTFLEIAKELLSQRNCYNISLLMGLLENIKSDKVMELLKQKSQEVGSPLIRGYASLALFRSGDSEAFKASFINWLKTQKGEHMFDIKPVMDRGAREDNTVSNYQLEPDDRANLLLESFITLAHKHETEGITLLMELMREGHPKNRFVLAGVLLKSLH